MFFSTVDYVGVTRGENMTLSVIDDLRLGVFDPIRRLCESRQFQFFVLLQNSTQPSQKYWASSKQLSSFFGNWITEVATKVEVEDSSRHENSADPDQSNFCDDNDPEWKPVINSINSAAAEDDCVLLPESEEEEEVSTTAEHAMGVKKRKVERSKQSLDQPEQVDGLDDAGSINDAKSQLVIPRINKCFDLRRYPIWRHKRPLQDDNPAIQYLDDDFDSELLSSPSSATLAHIQSQPSPTIWKEHQFVKPLRPSLVKRLFEDKLEHRAKAVHPYSIMDNEYADVLKKVIHLRNPHCIFRTSVPCWYSKPLDTFRAGFTCRFTSCLAKAHVSIEAGTNMVSVNFEPTKLKAPAPQESPYLTFAGHGFQDTKMGQEVSVAKIHHLPKALTSKQLKDFFLSDLVYDELDKKYVVSSRTNGHVLLLEQILKGANPHCRFQVVLTPCYQMANNAKEDLTPRCLSIRLGCIEKGCKVQVQALIRSPSGDVEFKFRKTKTTLSRDKTDNDLLDSISLDHRGCLEPDNKCNSDDLSPGLTDNDSKEAGEDEEMAASSNTESSPIEVLTLPAHIEHEPLSQEIVKKYFRDKVNIPRALRKPKEEYNQAELRKGRQWLPDSSWMTIVRPIVSNYNSRCCTSGGGTKVLKGSTEVKCILQCKRKDCDFESVVYVNYMTGSLKIHFRNQSSKDPAAGSMNNEQHDKQFCYIRHAKDSAQPYWRKEQRRSYYGRVLNMEPAEISRMFGVSRKLGQKLRREAKEEKRRLRGGISGVVSPVANSEDDGDQSLDPEENDD